MSQSPISALLLAAGLGTRLRPLTLSKPKCLMEIGGKPLLEHWLQNLDRCGCTNTLVNTHYLAEQVDAFLRHREKSKMNIETFYEPKLLGTAGTLMANLDFFENKIVLLIHADNVTNFDINELVLAHRSRPRECVLTMLTFTTNNPQCCGIVETDHRGVVQCFHEKVKHPPGNQANGAIYAFDSSFIQILKSIDSPLSDFSTQVLPRMVGRIATCHTTKNFIDIGTPDNLRKAQKLWLQPS